MASAVSISPARTEPRTDEILDRIKSVFAAKGFDGASMQDLARAAGMSAGNFYRYFPSKSAIIEALVQRDLEEVQADFARIMQSPSPREALCEVIRRRLEVMEEEEGALWAEIEAAAARRAEIAALHLRMGEQIVLHLTRVFARIGNLSEAEAMHRHAARAELIILMVRGAAVSSCGPQGRGAFPPDAALRELVLRLVDQLLGEVVAEAAACPAVLQEP